MATTVKASIRPTAYQTLRLLRYKTNQPITELIDEAVNLLAARYAAQPTTAADSERPAEAA